LQLAKLYFLLKQRKYLWFSAFPNFRKLGEFAAFIERLKAKSVSASGRLRPPDPHQGLCPSTPLGAPPPDPRYRLALCALAMPPLPNPKYATGWLVNVYTQVIRLSPIQVLIGPGVQQLRWPRPTPTPTIPTSSAMPYPSASDSVRFSPTLLSAI